MRPPGHLGRIDIGTRVPGVAQCGGGIRVRGQAEHVTRGDQPARGGSKPIDGEVPAGARGLDDDEDLRLVGGRPIRKDQVDDAPVTGTDEPRDEAVVVRPRRIERVVQPEGVGPEAVGLVWSFGDCYESVAGGAGAYQRPGWLIGVTAPAQEHACGEQQEGSSQMVPCDHFSNLVR